MMKPKLRMIHIQAASTPGTRYPKPHATAFMCHRAAPASSAILSPDPSLRPGGP